MKTYVIEDILIVIGDVCDGYPAEFLQRLESGHRRRLERKADNYG